MKRAVLLALLLLLIAVFAAQTTEYFTDPDQPVSRPCQCTGTWCPPKCNMASSRSWKSKMDAQAPMGYVADDYIAVLTAFYDTVYDPAGVKPTEAQVNTFLASSAGTVSGVDRSVVKEIILDAFHLDRVGTAASREEKSQMFKPSDENLAPDMGRDELRTRAEDDYNPANVTPSTKFSEGNYAPIKQTKPTNPGQWDDGSMLWKGPRPASVCPCAENIM